MTITDEMLIAYADGEADAGTRSAVEAALREDPVLLAQLARHRRMRDELSAAFDPTLEEPVPSRLFDAVAAGSVIGLDQARAGRAAPWRALAAMAACLVVGLVVGGQWAARGPIGADLTARGALASALDSQLAGQDQTGKPVRLAVSFRKADGGYCRTFQTPGENGLAGVACREGQRWRVMTASRAPASQSEFRTASSLPEPVARAVESLMTGEPLDAAAEAKAKVAGWR